jgi:hypothetical protein
MEYIVTRKVIKILRKCDKEANDFVKNVIMKMSRLQDLEGCFIIDKYGY